jgi:hypothetical protein
VDAPDILSKYMIEEYWLKLPQTKGEKLYSELIGTEVLYIHWLIASEPCSIAKAELLQTFILLAHSCYNEQTLSRAKSGAMSKASAAVYREVMRSRQRPGVQWLPASKHSS